MPNIANRVVNVRQSPGETTPILSTITDTQTYRAIAQGTEADGRVWYQLESRGWVAERVLDRVGPCAQLPTGTTTTTAPTATPSVVASATSAIRSAPQAVPAASQVVIPSTRQILTAGNSAQIRLLAAQTGLQTSQLLIAGDSTVLQYEGGPEAQLYRAGQVSAFSPTTPSAPTFLALNGDGTRYAMTYTAPEGTLLAVQSTAGDGLATPLLWLINANQAVFSPDGRWLVTYFYNGTIAANGKTVLNFLNTDGTGQDSAVEYNGMITRVAFNADGTRLAFVVVDSAGQNFVDVIDPLNPTALLQTLPTGHSHANQYGTAGLAFSPGGATLALGTIDGKVLLWDTATWTLRSTLEVLPQSMISALHFDPSGTLLAVAGGLPPIPPATLPSGVVVLMVDANTGALLASLSGHVGMVTQLGFSSDGTLLVSSSNQGEIKWWGVAP
jgi:WD40 repeat protein